MLQPLEPRVHLSAVLTYKGVLIVAGTDAADVIELVRSGSALDQVDVRLNGTSQGLFRWRKSSASPSAAAKAMT